MRGYPISLFIQPILQVCRCKFGRQALEKCLHHKAIFPNINPVYKGVHFKPQISHHPYVQVSHPVSYRKPSYPVYLCFYNCLHLSSIIRQKLTLDHKGIQRLLQKYINRYNVAEKMLAEGKVENAKDLSFQITTLNPLVSLTKQVDKIKTDLTDLDVLIKGLDRTKESELVVAAEEEKKKCLKKFQELETAIVELLMPQEEIDDKDLIIEISAGVGGQEAMLFSREVFDMYCNYAAWKGWNCEVLDYETSDVGGLRHAKLSICGESVCKFLKLEGGVHRVQRIPLTEKSGRIHTSTTTVAVLPQPTEIDIVLSSKDLVIETKRSSGPGGQHVNKTDSCVRITHLPTGIAVECQQQRSQHKNKEYAMRTLRAKLYKLKLDAQMNLRQRTRKLQVGTAARSEKVRTYNFVQDRISDHRLNDNMHGMKEFLLGEEKLDNLINALLKKTQMEALLEVLEEYDS